MALLMTEEICAQNFSELDREKKVSVAGSLSSRFVFYNSSGIESRRDPFGYLFGGNATLSVYDLSLPFSFTYSNQGTSFGQPFNQFGISPSYKWATLHLGYRNISYSSLTLNGHQMRGAGFELKPGKLRVGFISGRLRRAVPVLPLDTMSLDTLQNQLLPRAQDPVYKRKGWAAKIGYGDDANFVDLILFKGADDASSLEGDSISNITTPAENAVIGINARKRIGEKFTLFFEGALSSYTLDKELPENDSLNLSFFQQLLKPFNSLNNSSHFYTAIKTGLSYSTSKFNIRTQYDRIDPDYQSMGAYFFNNDLESFSIVPTFYLFKNKVNVTSSLRVQHDNLQNKKAYTTHRVTPRLNLSINPSYKYGIDISYQDMITYQKPGTEALNEMTKMDMSNPGFTMVGRLNYVDTVKTQNITLMWNRFSLKDKNSFTSPYSEYTALIMNITYNLYFIKSGLGLNASGMFNKLDNFSGITNTFGISTGASKSFAENKLTANTSLNFNFSDFGNTQSITTALNYNPNAKHGFNFQVVYMTNDQGTAKYKEFSGFFEYRYNF